MAAGVLALLAACGTGGDRAAPSVPPRAAARVADSVVLERSTCFGSCPAYRLSVAASGRVAFLSRNPGDEGRAAADSISPDAAARLLARAADAGVFTLPDTVLADPRLCPMSATDFPWFAVTVFGPAGAKRVADYEGCHEQMGQDPRDWRVAPALAPLRAYEDAIDSAAGSARWVRPAVQ